MISVRMKSQEVETLLAVVENGSIGEAARLLHLSRTAATKSMGPLEEEARLALLLRSTRGVDLTEAGRGLAARDRLVTRQVALSCSPEPA